MHAFKTSGKNILNRSHKNSNLLAVAYAIGYMFKKENTFMREESNFNFCLERKVTSFSSLELLTTG